MKKIAITTLFSLLAATPAIAADFYVGLKAGKAHHSYSSVQSGTAILNNDQSGVGFLAGGKINEILSIEIEYTKLGGYDTTSSRTIKGSAVGFSGVASLPLEDKLYAFGKVGISNTTLEDSASQGFAGAAISQHKTGISTGLGIQYDVTAATGIQGGFDFYPEGDAKSISSSVNLWYLAGVFKF